MTAAQIEAWFPSLNGLNYHITSPESPAYNCIAWAADSTVTPWWPFPGAGHYWPPTVPRELTVPAFVAAFGSIGYHVCADDALEPGYEKVAIYAKNGVPQHAAKQLASGRWTSKLGGAEDIDHLSPAVLQGTEYGHVAVVLRRALAVPPAADALVP